MGSELEAGAHRILWRYFKSASLSPICPPTYVKETYLGRPALLSQHLPSALRKVAEHGAEGREGRAGSGPVRSTRRIVKGAQALWGVQ